MVSGKATFSEKGKPTYLDTTFLGVRFKNWLAIGGLYALFYMTRYNFTANMGPLSSYFGWDKGQLGYFESMMPFVYGIAVILNSWYTDRVGGKRAFTLGAIGVIAANVLSGIVTLLVATPAIMEGTGKDEHLVSPAIMHFGLSGPTVLMAMVIIWGLNGFFQSFGAIAIVKINAAWFHKNERGEFSGWFGLMIRGGLLLGFSVTPLLAKYLPIGCVYFVPGILLAGVLIFHLLFVEDSPEKAGVIGFTTGEPVEKDKPGFKQIFQTLYGNWRAWFFVLIMIMIGFVRRGSIDSWYSKYFTEMDSTLHFGDWPYQIAAWSIAILGILGGIFLGRLSDRLYPGKPKLFSRPPVIILGFLGMVIFLILGHSAVASDSDPYLIAILLGCLSFFVNGAHGIIGGAVSMDFGKSTAGSAAGLFDGAQYLVAGTLVGSTLGQLLKTEGWNIWLGMLIPFAVIGLILTIILWGLMWREEKKAAKAVAGH